MKALEEAVKRKVNVNEDPDMVGALGAALLAFRRMEKIHQDGGKGTITEKVRVVQTNK